jgi:two-component SAPR family response regulator
MVLVVEDELAIADDIAEIIVRAGGKVLGPVPTVSSALQLIERECPDLATLDSNLRVESAVSIALRLQDLKVPFVVVTGYSNGALPKQLQGVPNIVKPYEPETVVEALAELWLKAIPRSKG